MDKELLIEVCDRIHTQVEDFKQVDIDWGQLSAQGRPPVASPVCLVDTAYMACEDTDGNNQKVTATITLRMAFNSTNRPTHAEVSDRDIALGEFDIIRKVHIALQGWDNTGAFDPLTRVSAQCEKRADSMRIYRVVYRTSFIDEF